MSNRLRIGFISTRFTGTDGVSLETQKWASVLERFGHTCFYRHQRGQTEDGRKIYALEDVFLQANLEAVYYRRPVVVNNYSIFDVDIKPRGFRVIEFDGYITDAAVRQTRQILEDPALAQ